MLYHPRLLYTSPMFCQIIKAAAFSTLVYEYPPTLSHCSMYKLGMETTLPHCSMYRLGMETANKAKHHTDTN